MEDTIGVDKLAHSLSRLWSQRVQNGRRTPRGLHGVSTFPDAPNGGACRDAPTVANDSSLVLEQH